MGVIDSNDFNLFTRCFRQRFPKERAHLLGIRCRGKSEGKDKYGFDVRPQRCRGLGQLDSKLAKTRTQTVYNSRFTTWRRHEILRQFECFRRSPSVPIASRTEHPRFLRFEPSVESG